MTDKLRQATQQALEALEKEPADYADWIRTMKAARAALRAALAEQPAEQGSNIHKLLSWIVDECVVYPESADEKAFAKRLLDAITHPKSGYTAPQPAKPAEQEPVAWLPSAEWTACVKLPVTVHVRQQRPGETHVSTREGITPVKPDDLIMRGVSGEEYPIGREIFERTYRLGEAPQPAKRVPLTDEAIAALWLDSISGPLTATKFARAIELAHGIGEQE